MNQGKRPTKKEEGKNKKKAEKKQNGMVHYRMR